MENILRTQLCACMGPQGNDPVCPCKMKAIGEEPHNSWTLEEIERLKNELSKMYNWKDNNDQSNFKK